MQFALVALALSAAAPFVVPGVNAQPSARAICYTCPEHDNALRPLSREPFMGSNPFACPYGDADDVCYYSVDGALAQDNNNSGCPDTAFNLCQRRREERKARALPRSPRAPSPAAFATKPKVMQVRKVLSAEKAKRNA